ncbi:uncharacterized protein B0H18DRAFT_1099286 [Fomitopsis serialis]|uniref:uncharacterized protein n=1 Tax=Fomitopsis serialis TaxID=139415 RepID=UPI002008DCC7|nr:uncharacterized protein B0H18DRAFT_1099286 [Neoantrodia serialis]KAH9909460.1 hypothetical protein B0H18DRAFT_1099286 [Neoantrodia serialis]
MVFLSWHDTRPFKQPSLFLRSRPANVPPTLESTKPTISEKRSAATSMAVPVDSHTDHHHPGLNELRRADDELLAKLGYKSEFKHEFSLIETIAFTFFIMSWVSSCPSPPRSPSLSSPVHASGVKSVRRLMGGDVGGHVGMVFGWLIPSLIVMAVAVSMAELASSTPTSAGLYYFSAKLAPPKYSALASWITGWANIAGQVTLVCSIDFICAPVVASDSVFVLGTGPTYGIFLAIPFVHGMVCARQISSLSADRW